MRFQVLALFLAVLGSASMAQAAAPSVLGAWHPDIPISVPMTPIPPKVQPTDMPVCGFVGCCQRRECASERNNATGVCETCSAK